MRIAVVGAGALGGFFGGLLARAGQDVTFIARGRTHDALAQRGLTVRSKLAGEFSIPVEATDNPASIGPVDLVFFSVKAYDLDAAARSIAPLIGPGTALLAVQNGIEHLDQLRGQFGPETVIPGVVYISATVEEPGFVAQIGGPGIIHFGDGAQGHVPNAKLDLVESTLAAGGIGNVRHADIEPELWKKFMFICAMSGVSALTRLTLRQIFDCLETGAFYYDVMAEVATVARAAGVDLPESAPDEAMDGLLTMPALPERGSMAYDLMAGRRLELETLNGAVVRLGARYGVPVPANRAIYAALKPYTAGPPISA